jgi:hypothetical protein
MLYFKVSSDLSRHLPGSDLCNQDQRIALASTWSLDCLHSGKDDRMIGPNQYACWSTTACARLHVGLRNDFHRGCIDKARYKRLYRMFREIYPNR